MTPTLEGAEKCPHCGALAVLEPSRKLRWRCAVCGGGRVPGVGALGPSTVGKLEAARRGSVVELGARAGGVVLLACALALGLLGLLLAARGAAVAATAFGVLAVLSGLAAGVLRRVRRTSGAAWREALDDAWTDGAEAFARAREGSITAADLAAALRVSEDDAQSLLSRLSARGARVSIDDDASLRYRFEPVSQSDAAEPDGDGAPDAARLTAAEREERGR